MQTDADDRAAREACDYDRSVTGSRLPSRDAKTCYREALDSVKTMMASKIEAARDPQRGG